MLSQYIVSKRKKSMVNSLVRQGMPMWSSTDFFLLSFFFFLRSSFFVLHSSFFVLRSSLFILRSSFFVLLASRFFHLYLFFLLLISSHPSSIFVLPMPSRLVFHPYLRPEKKTGTSIFGLVSGVPSLYIQI